VKSRHGVSRIWVAIALAVVIAFVGGFMANSQLTRTTGNAGVVTVGDSYPYGECLGPCPQHSFPFATDIVTVTVTHLGGVVYQAAYPNLITNAGEDVISRQTGCGATSAPACANGGVFIALSTDSGAPAAADTVCPSESAVSGLARALGTYAHSAGTNTHTISHTFTLGTAGAVVIAKVCMLDAASGGSLFAETLLASTATVNAVGDQITITWTFTH
jgi:hypothetical protein